MAEYIVTEHNIHHPEEVKKKNKSKEFMYSPRVTNKQTELVQPWSCIIP